MLRAEKISIEEFLPLMMSAAGVVGVSPFMVIRALNGEWTLAIFDFAVVCGLLGLFTYMYRTRRLRVASLAMAILCVAGTLATIYLKGAQQIFWAYPALLALFFLTRPAEAVVIAILAMIAMVPVLMPTSDAIGITTVLITLSVVSMFAYIFAAIARGQHRALMRLATRDPLTGAANRRALDEKLDELVRDRRRNPLPASLVMLDLDHFKRLNDTHGHAVGDGVLVSLTEVLRMRLRLTDSLYRIGGEEFVVISEGSDLEGAEHLARQLRTLVEANELGPGMPVTISLGVAEHQGGETAAQWLRRADEALYSAKREGRNQVRVAGAGGPRRVAAATAASA
jgi:diguanylate cyclase (GGDEF)-like protein